VDKLCLSILWKVELAVEEIEYLAEISRQSIRGMVWFHLTACTDGSQLTWFHLQGFDLDFLM
jgi:hypothetical protein